MHKVRRVGFIAVRPQPRAQSPVRHVRTLAKPRAFKAPAPPNHNTIVVGMRAFFSLASKWGLTPDEERTLLGLPGRSTYFNWKRGEVGEVAHGLDLATRISHLLGIFRGLETIYEDPNLADAWVRRPNEAFNGQSALERMLAGQVTDLADVRYYIDSVIS